MKREDRFTWGKRNGKVWLVIDAVKMCDMVSRSGDVVSQGTALMENFGNL